MKLKFIKKGDDIDVCLVNSDESTTDFSYVEMVNRLYEDQQAEAPVLEGDFTESEMTSIRTLIEEINAKCIETPLADSDASQDR